jgi:hypothetical protein
LAVTTTGPVILIFCSSGDVIEASRAGAGLERSPAKIPRRGMTFYIWCHLALQIAEYSAKTDMYGSRSLLNGGTKQEEIGRVEPLRLFGAHGAYQPRRRRIDFTRPGWGGGDRSLRVGP